MRQAIAGALHADETKIFPISLCQFAIRRRHGDLEKIAAARGFVGKAFAGRKCARLDKAHQLPGRVQPSDLIENIVAQVTKLEFDSLLLERVQVLEQVGFYESQRRRGDRYLMKPQTDSSVCDHGIRMQPRIAPLGAREAKTHVKIQ